MRLMMLALILVATLSGVSDANSKPYFLYTEYKIAQVRVPQVKDKQVTGLWGGPALISNVYLENDQSIPLTFNGTISFKALSPVEFGGISPIGDIVQQQNGKVTFQVNAETKFQPFSKTLVMQIFVPFKDTLNNSKITQQPVAALGDDIGRVKFPYGVGSGVGNLAYMTQYFITFELRSQQKVDFMTTDNIIIPDKFFITETNGYPKQLVLNNGKWEPMY